MSAKVKNEETPERDSIPKPVQLKATPSNPVSKDKELSQIKEQMDTLPNADLPDVGSFQGHETMGSHFANDKDANLDFRAIFDGEVENQNSSIQIQDQAEGNEHQDTFDKQDFTCTNFHDSDNSIKMIENYQIDNENENDLTLVDKSILSQINREISEQDSKDQMSVVSAKKDQNVSIIGNLFDVQQATFDKEEEQSLDKLSHDFFDNQVETSRFS